MSQPEMIEIDRTKKETPTIKSFYFDWGKDISPGQFIMVWLPGVDEIPMSLSYRKDKQGITVKDVGETTERLHGLEPGDKIGIRGPFGSGYRLEEEDILAIVGGIGGASLRPALVEASREGKNLKVGLGGVSEEELLFEDLFGEIGELSIATDDGSHGHEGFVTELLPKMIDEDIELILTCGPEVMMKKTVDIARENGVPIQASLERYMKCGLGLCDSCSIDGFQVCRDGPVFDQDELKEMDEFGKFERDKTGIKRSIK